MTEYRFELKIDLLRNIPFVLDAILEIGVGVVMATGYSTGSITGLIFGWAFIVFGLIQLLRKIKTFHLTDTELIVRRPLFPFRLAEHRFSISTIKEIKFVNVKGRFGGPHLTLATRDDVNSFRIETTKERIDEFEIQLKLLGLVPVRENM